ncbi:hydroxysqualene dehydroxylase HpnE [Streptomyces sp. TRM 70361]|uniref:hydroxysqualene dehydroxylase HpnE n=1 Tax=Streptomyces sp. TRM 70361 TaxID=3116553 RepID=UPI002E7B75AF|nr:hydroxysqualene dehydroxylase HpnE [Streptomyces sp. TRM 70361]MEE1942128.1 hydroxysqualene dehydroxylase HpnE [Streptomyces sp. TRM 70361]
MTAPEAAPPTVPEPVGSRAVVVGGGLAGITAALRLAEAGIGTTLVEARPRLGGLAFSFRRTGAAGELTVDNGHHVHLRCCTAYRWFLERIGASALAPVQRRLDIPVLDAARGRVGRLRRTALPAPLHLAAGLARYPHLSPAERLRAGRAALALKRLGTVDPADPALDGTDFASWLHRHGQSPRAIRALWDLVGVATLNARAPQVSLGLAAMVFRTGLLTEPGAADLGWSRVPLGRLHDTLAGEALERAGVRVVRRARVRELTPEPDGTWRITVGAGGSGDADGGGGTLTAGTVVLAVPQRDAHRLLPPGALPEPDRLLRIGTAPILNVHVVYDRRVLHRPFLAALGTPVQWIFDRTEASGLRAPGGTDGGTGGTADGSAGAGPQYLALSQSAAGDEIDLPVAVLRERYLAELARLLPAARTARVRDFFVTRERTATFAPAPGVGRLRPAARTDTPGVWLAGSWTATGWPATMEGAVRSGLTAAREALAALGRPYEDPYGGPHDGVFSEAA